MRRPTVARRIRASRFRHGLIGLALLGGTSLPLLPIASPSRAQIPAAAPTAVPTAIPTTVPAPPRTPRPSAAQMEVKARAAAERILTALQNGDANARFAQFAPSLQRVSSPAMVASSMKTMPRLLSWRITTIQPGYDSSGVEVILQTSAGRRDLLMVINADGKLEGYHFDATDKAAEVVVRDFMAALTNGHFISASSFLSPTLQEEIPQAALQRKWQNLQGITGNFVKVRRISKAESTADMKLVIVNTEFNRLTDNLFVILDSRNQIVGVDFPTDPADPTPATPVGSSSHRH
jgi:hypothetical protein